MLDPPELQATLRRAAALVLRATTSLASISSVLFSEPQDGDLRDACTAGCTPADVARHLPCRHVDPDDRPADLGRRSSRMRHARIPSTTRASIIVVFVRCSRQCDAVVCIRTGRNHERRRRLLRPGGVRRDARRAADGRPPCARRPPIGCAVLLCALAIGWSVRAAGVHFVLRSQAIKHQIDWVELPGRWERDNQLAERSGRAAADPAASERRDAGHAAQYARRQAGVARPPLARMTPSSRFALLVAPPPARCRVLWMAVLAAHGASPGQHPIWRSAAPQPVRSGRVPGRRRRRPPRGTRTRTQSPTGRSRRRRAPGRSATLTPIEAAAATREREMVQLLLDLGASPDATVWQRAFCISDADERARSAGGASAVWRA